MRFLVAVGALSFGCMPVRVTRSDVPEPRPEPRRFKVGPQLVKLNESKEKATARLAQLAVGLGLRADEVSLKDGFFRGQRTRLDQWATDDLYDRSRSVGDVVRKLEITAVAGDGSAVLSARVTRCFRREGVREDCGDVFMELEEDELLILDKLMRVIMPTEPPASPPPKPSSDI